MLVTPLATQKTEEMMIRVPLRTRERDRDGRTRARKTHSTRRSARMENARTIVIARDQSTDDRGEEGVGGKSGESSVNSIRIALVYIRGQDSPRAILPSRISARRADYVRGRGIDGTPFSRGRAR